MALSRHRRDSNIIWPGFVDAVTTLLMVMIFVLTIFTVTQTVLREQITSKDAELDTLGAQLSALSEALGMERQRAEDLTGELGLLRASLADARAEGSAQAQRILGLEGDLAAREASLSETEAKITAFEAQVARLLSERDSAQAGLVLRTSERDAARAEAEGLGVSLADLEAAKAQLISEAEAMQLALAQARQEIDETTEAARLAAARREAIEALLAEMRQREGQAQQDLGAARAALSETEAARLADAAALATLRARLEGAQTELTAMTLSLEAERKRAEETLTLLAAARKVADEGQSNLGQSERALAVAEAMLLAEKDKALAAARNVELLNQQMAALREQLSGLQAVLDESEAGRADSQIQLESLGRDLNAALAQVAAEQRARAELEEAERKRLEAENQDLARFRSDFFGKLSQIFEGREGVRVVGDRFVFSSEVLFQPGSADLAPEGRAQIASVMRMLNDVRQQIPPELDWIIRVDGHTDNMPLSGTGAFRDNWALSQARALSVVRYLQDDLGFPPDRLAATGFGEYRPLAQGNSESARAQNRRIELKLTER